MNDPSKRVFRACLYRADTGRNKCIYINKDQFGSDEEAIKYLRTIQAENRQRNALIRRDGQRARINEVITRPAPTSPLDDIVFESEVDVNIDKGTGSSIVIFGASKRGKTTLMMYLYLKYYTSKKKINTLFSGNPQLKIYKDDPNLLVSYGFDAKSAKYIQLQQYINVKTKNKYRFTDLFDDIIDAKYSKILNKLVLTYRNSNISSIICLQYVCMLSKQNRSSVNHTFIFGANSGEDTDTVIKLILRPFLVKLGITRFDDMMAFYQRVTADHGFIYINNITQEISFHRLKL